MATDTLEATLMATDTLDPFELDVRISTPHITEQPEGFLSFGTTCWSCGRYSCNGTCDQNTCPDATCNTCFCTWDPCLTP
jgi:hypothetical protein